LVFTQTLDGVKIDRELVIVSAGRDLLDRGQDRVALLGGDDVEVGVRARRGGLDPGQCVDQRRVQGPAADRDRPSAVRGSRR